MKRICLFEFVLLAACLLVAVPGYAQQAVYPPIPEDGNPFGSSDLGGGTFYDQYTIDKTDDEQVCPETDQFNRPLSEISVSMRIDSGELPPDCSGGVFSSSRYAGPRFDSIREVNWRPTNFFHQPLYFDDQPLERYGQSVCPPLQPVISGAKFFGSVPLIPYKIGVNRTHDCISTLGYYRPGSCAPCLRQTLPWEHDASLLETAFILTLVFALP